jgi:hypothetical protein
MKKATASIIVLLACATVLAQQTSRVFFDLGYDTAESPAPVSVRTGYMMQPADKPMPVREGYRFGGWYTSPECLPEQEWRFGSNSSFYTPATDSMKVETSMILYAKWVSPTPVRTAEDLDAIRNDLYGWYVLENDIDLSNIPNWTPIGEYEGDYEFAPGEWWRYAFKGILDGAGHTIKGLTITDIRTDKAGLFGTVANGEIVNLNMDGSRLGLTAPRPYLGPLAGILKQDDGQVCAVRNCRVTNTKIKVKTTNEESTFHSFTGLCGGAWGGTLEDIFVSGTMDIEIAGTGGGELYVGPYLGEAYNDTRRCSSDYDITIRFSKPQPAEGFKAYIGGLQASGTYIDACEARGRIRVSGRTGSEQVFIGGIVGSERYGTVSGCSSSVRMEAADTGFAQAGGIVGEFNSSYGVIGAAFGVTTTVVKDCSYAGRPVFRRVSRHLFGETAGAGEPEALSSPWGLAMAYRIENCTYKTR